MITPGRDVFVVGVGMTRFAKHLTRSIESLGHEAVQSALADTPIAGTKIDEAFCGHSYGGPLLGQRILRDLAMTGMPITNVENACSSGSSALREAVSAVALGRADVALVIGVEKLTASGGGPLQLEATDLEAAQGMVMPALYAMRAQRYLFETGASPDSLASVAVKAHRHGALNPYAQFQNEVSIEEVRTSRMIAEPLTLYMCCPTGDGAAAAIVASDPTIGSNAHIRVAASILQSGTYEPGHRDLARSALTERTARLAYAAAALGPDDVDVAEVHDAFAIAELMYYEALGFCENGAGADFLARGESSIGGRLPVNPSGGLLCRGHPVGATGIAQICEAVWQLRGQAGDRQVQDAHVALTHCTGGGIAGLDHGACSIHVLTR